MSFKSIGLLRLYFSFLVFQSKCSFSPYKVCSAFFIVFFFLGRWSLLSCIITCNLTFNYPKKYKNLIFSFSIWVNVNHKCLQKILIISPFYGHHFYVLLSCLNSEWRSWGRVSEVRAHYPMFYWTALFLYSLCSISKQSTRRDYIYIFYLNPTLGLHRNFASLEF